MKLYLPTASAASGVLHNIGINYKDPGAQDASDAFFTVIGEACIKALANRQINHNAPVRALVDVAALHGRTLTQYPEGTNPDSPTYTLWRGTNGKRPVYLINGSPRYLAFGTFFGNQSSFSIETETSLSMLKQLLSEAEAARVIVKAQAAAKAAITSQRPAVELVVTRHPGLVEYLRETGLANETTQVIEHASGIDVTGKRVCGVLPHSLSCLCESFTEVPLPELPKELRGVELSLEQVRKYAAAPVTYKIRKL